MTQLNPMKGPAPLDLEPVDYSEEQSEAALIRDMLAHTNIPGDPFLEEDDEEPSTLE